MKQYIYAVHSDIADEKCFKQCESFEEALEFAQGCKSRYYPYITEIELDQDLDTGSSIPTGNDEIVWRCPTCEQEQDALINKADLTGGAEVVPVEQPTEKVVVAMEVDPEQVDEFYNTFKDYLDGFEAKQETVIDPFADNLFEDFEPKANKSLKNIDFNAMKEALEENEDEVECVWCNELYPKEEMIKDKDLGYVCPRCVKGIESKEGKVIHECGDFEGTGMSEKEINNLSQDELEDMGTFDNLNESKYSDEANDIRRSVDYDIRYHSDEGYSEENYYYNIGTELAARDLPFIPNYFLPDHVIEGDKEYEDLKQGYLDNGGKIEDVEESLTESKDVPVVDCPVNDVITHSEDEKPLDCKMKKKPLEKPLTEAEEENPVKADSEADSSTSKTSTSAADVAQEITKLNYEDFVKKLDTTDCKSQAFAKYIKDTITNGNSDLGDAVKLSVKEGAVPCKELLPTQDKVILEKSLGLIADDKNAAFLQDILTKPTACFNAAGQDNPNGKTITYGKAIIDGHHRWSKIYTLNSPEAQCGVIAFNRNGDISTDDMLKATELAIRAIDQDLTLSQGNTDGTNMFTCTEENLKAITDKISPKCLEVFKTWKPELDSKEKVHAHIWKNIQSMQSNNKPILMNSRAVMPQTDLPANKQGGAIDLLKQGAIDTTAVAESKNVSVLNSQLTEGYNKQQFQELMELSAQYGLEKVIDWQKVCEKMHIADPLEAMRALAREKGKDYKMDSLSQLFYDISNPNMPGGGEYVDPDTGNIYDKHNNLIRTGKPLRIKNESLAPEYTIEINGKIYTDEDGNSIIFNSCEKAQSYIDDHELERAEVVRQYGKAKYEEALARGDEEAAEAIRKDIQYYDEKSGDQPYYADKYEDKINSLEQALTEDKVSLAPDLTTRQNLRQEKGRTNPDAKYIYNNTNTSYRAATKIAKDNIKHTEAHLKFLKKQLAFAQQSPKEFKNEIKQLEQEYEKTKYDLQREQEYLAQRKAWDDDYFAQSRYRDSEKELQKNIQQYKNLKQRIYFLQKYTINDIENEHPRIKKTNEADIAKVEQKLAAAQEKVEELVRQLERAKQASTDTGRAALIAEFEADKEYRLGSAKQALEDAKTELAALLQKPEKQEEALTEDVNPDLFTELDNAITLCDQMLAEALTEAGVGLFNKIKRTAGKIFGKHGGDVDKIVSWKVRKYKSDNETVASEQTGISSYNKASELASAWSKNPANGKATVVADKFIDNSFKDPNDKTDTKAKSDSDFKLPYAVSAFSKGKKVTNVDKFKNLQNALDSIAVEIENNKTTNSNISLDDETVEDPKPGTTSVDMTDPKPDDTSANTTDPKPDNTSTDETKPNETPLEDPKPEEKKDQFTLVDDQDKRIKKSSNLKGLEKLQDVINNNDDAKIKDKDGNEVK